MKLFSRQNVSEGGAYVDAWIWCGKIMPYPPGSAPDGHSLVIRFPWFVMRPFQWGFRSEPRKRTHTPAFEVLHWEGHGPVTYRFFWLPFGKGEF
jgi:hypothetical protein